MNIVGRHLRRKRHKMMEIMGGHNGRYLFSYLGP